MLELLAVAAAGVGASASNTLAGGGSLITFFTMVALGVPPVSANVTSTVGLIPGAVGGTMGYADLLGGQRARLAQLAAPTLAGAVAGTALLLITPDGTFEAIVPILIAGACFLLLFQQHLVARISHSGSERLPLLSGGLALSGAYAAYFGVGLGILLLGVLGLFVAEAMQRLNAIKVLLAGLANLIAATAYAFLAPVQWRYALCLMVASVFGGHLGANLARRVSGETLRIGIASVGLLAASGLAVGAFF
jgi:uncharacterized membrane protein YfcA